MTTLEKLRSWVNDSFTGSICVNKDAAPDPPAYIDQSDACKLLALIETVMSFHIGWGLTRMSCTCKVCVALRALEED